MARIYRLSKTGLKILYKVRHHRGHGIHSPFVFNLITKVIEEKTFYHAYDDISFIVKSMHDKHYGRLNKYNKLLFRLSNYFKFKRILEIGSGYGINTLCLTAPSADASCICIESSEVKYTLSQKLYGKWDRKIIIYTDVRLPELQEKQDCISVDLSCLNLFHILDLNQYLTNLSHEKTMIIVKGIRTNKHNYMLWENIMNIDTRTAVLDLFNIGIVFFDTRLYRWNYRISF